MNGPLPSRTSCETTTDNDDDDDCSAGGAGVCIINRAVLFPRQNDTAIFHLRHRISLSTTTYCTTYLHSHEGGRSPFALDDTVMENG